MAVIHVSPWMIIDAMIWALMIMCSVWMRYDFSPDGFADALSAPRFYVLLLSLIVLSWLVGWGSGLYRGRFVPDSLLEASVLTTVFSAAAAVTFVVNFLTGTGDDVPRSTPLVAGAFTIIAALALRAVVRRRGLFGAGSRRDCDPAVVFGAGEGGRQLIRQLVSSEVSQFRPVAVLDDDPAKMHMRIDTVKVAGTRDDIAEVAQRTGASALLIAVPSLPGTELVDIRDRAEEAGLHVLVLPPLDDLMQGRRSEHELREINVNDLLGRKPARLNQTQIADYLRGKRIMVTGAGGSIGSELCRQLSRFEPAELMMLDRDESGLHATQLSIQDRAMLDGDDTILASIRDREAIMEIMERRKPHIVFHAAALKHMPLLEHYPLEALKTNVLGTLNVLDAAESAGVEAFVNVSTDKAANPCSALGTSKRVAERITAARAMDAERGRYVSVRFGNVLGSKGSVLTVFKKQIDDGGPVTVTHPEVDRYFMTIPEACQLVLQAVTVGETATTLVLDMGEPVKIAEVAKTLIERQPRRIDIVYTGLRANEKLSEVLFDDTEQPIKGAKHHALSEVTVPPLRPDRGELLTISDHVAATCWLEQNVYCGGLENSAVNRSAMRETE